jgi:hypothetical protein
LPWSYAVVEKSELIDTCNRYDVAPDDAIQFKVGLIETPTAPPIGELNSGAAGMVGSAVVVVKFQTGDQLLVPVTLAALKRQKYTVLFTRPPIACAVAVKLL